MEQDLLLLVADLDAESVFSGLLEKRRLSLGIRPIDYKIDRFIKRDSGCYLNSQDYLRDFTRQFSKVIVVFDRHGSGQEHKSSAELEQDVETRLSQNGWENRCSAIALDPEIEAWIWSDSSEVGKALGWGDRESSLSSWLLECNLITENSIKPNDPKSVLKRALKEVGKKPSAALFYDLATRVGLRRCNDPAFAKFKGVMAAWFPPVTPEL